MKYFISRQGGEEDDITSQSFDNYDDAYELLEEIYGDMGCSFTPTPLPNESFSVTMEASKTPRSKVYSYFTQTVHFRPNPLI